MNSRRSRILLAFAFALALIISVRASLRGGYIGPDYPAHIPRLIEWIKAFDFGATNPPLYYVFGHLVFTLAGPRNSFPIALSIIQIGLNLLALYFFFQYIRRRFESELLYVAFCLFLIFLPVRMIHSATIGADSLTIPLYVGLFILVDKVLKENSTWGEAVLLGLVLAAAVWTKYAFMALLPALLTVFVFFWLNRGWTFLRFLRICLFCLALASLLSLHSFWASSRVHGYNTEKHWDRGGIPPDMTYADLLWVKKNDIRLFRAPEYFKREILRAHQHSYLGLSHMCVFTDTMNLFQNVSVPQDFGRILIPDQKMRPPWKTPVMSASMSLGVIWTISALAGTAWLLVGAIKALVKGALEREQMLILMGTAYFLLLFLLIPFVHGGALFGYWTPRLILPALVSFFLAGFLLIDRRVALNSNKAALVIFSLVVVQCLLEVIILT